MKKSKAVLETLNLDLDDFFCVTLYTYKITIIGVLTPSLLTKLSKLGYVFALDKKDNFLSNFLRAESVVDSIIIDISLSIRD